MLPRGYEHASMGFPMEASPQSLVGGIGLGPWAGNSLKFIKVLFIRYLMPHQGRSPRPIPKKSLSLYRWILNFTREKIVGYTLSTIWYFETSRINSSPLPTK